MIIDLLCKRWVIRVFENSMQQMYKVFFNDRRIYLMDEMPDIEDKEQSYICAFRGREDLEPQLQNFLKSGREADLYVYSPEAGDPFEVFRSCFRNIPAAGGLVKNSRDQYLIIFRRGKWDLPKGKAEPKEISQETALREVQEECGLEGLELGKFLIATYHIYFIGDEAVLKKTDWYLMKYAGHGEPVPLRKESIEKAIWMSHSEVEGISGESYPSIFDVIGSD